LIFTKGVDLEATNLVSRWTPLTPVKSSGPAARWGKGNLKVQVAPVFRLPDNPFPAQAVAGQFVVR